MSSVVFGKTAGGASASGAPACDLYLPVDTRECAPNVETQIGKDGSLLETVRLLIDLRKRHPALCADGDFSVVYAHKDKYPFVFMRSCGDQRILVAVNPSAKGAKIDLDGIGLCEVLAGKGAVLDGSVLDMNGVSYGIFREIDRN